MPDILLTDVVKYYKNLPHQNAALNFLQNNLPVSVLKEFSDLYRESPKTVVPEDNLSRILSYCNLLNITLDSHQNGLSINLIGLKGVNPDFTVNSNKLNEFNDLILVVSNYKGTYKILQTCVGSVEPGSYYTYNPLNPKGAARLLCNMKHEKVWQVGVHGSGRSAHEALVQTGNKVTVARDGNKDGNSDKDYVESGYFAINCHWGYNYPLNNIDKASAGCVVIRDFKEQKEFMSHVKKDSFYAGNRKHCFSFILLDGSILFGGK